MGSRSIIQRFFCSGVMRMFGKYSYAAYIWHPFVGAVMLKIERESLHGEWRGIVNLPLMVAATLLVSMASYGLIERPFLMLKDRFRARFSAPPEKAIGMATAAD